MMLCFCGINIPLHNVLEMNMSWPHPLFGPTELYMMKVHILQLESDFVQFLSNGPIHVYTDLNSPCIVFHWRCIVFKLDPTVLKDTCNIQAFQSEYLILVTFSYCCAFATIFLYLKVLSSETTWSTARIEYNEDNKSSFLYAIKQSPLFIFVF